MILASLTIFTAYILYIVFKYGVQQSVSATYEKTGVWFTLVMWGSAMPVIYARPEMLLYISCSGLLIVGAIPFVKKSNIHKWLHRMGAGICIAAGTFFFIDYINYFILMVVTYLCTIVFPDKNKVWWLEIAAYYLIVFGLTFIK